ASSLKNGPESNGRHMQPPAWLVSGCRHRPQDFRENPAIQSGRDGLWKVFTPEKVKPPVQIGFQLVSRFPEIGELDHGEGEYVRENSSGFFILELRMGKVSSFWSVGVGKGQDGDHVGIPYPVVDPSARVFL